MNRLVSALALSLMTLTAVRPLSCAQNVSVIPLVPAANWRLAATQGLGVDEIKTYGGDPAVEREYGVKSFEVRTYQLERARVQVVLESAADVSAAYGLLTYYQNESMHPEKAIQLAMTGPQGSLMARGRSFIRFLRPKDSQVSDNELRALLILVGGTRPTSDSLSNLPPSLPPSGLIPGSGKYVMGPETARRVLPNFPTDLIRFDQGAEVQVGEYLVGNSRSTMVEVSYPTPQIARLRFAGMSDSLRLNQDRGTNSLYARREGSFIFLALKASNKAAATKFLDQFNVNQQLSWDEKYPGDKTIGRQLFELIMGNVFLTLVLAGGGLAGGLLIVLSRRVTAKVFPAWEWGHPESDRLIRLNLQ
jgi:hypothetical protein